MLSNILLQCFLGFVPISHAGLHCVYCCDGSDEDDRVTVTVVAILASTENEKTDAKLKEVARELRKKRPEFKGFRLARITSLPMAVGAREKIGLVDEQEVVIEAKQCRARPSRICLKVKAPTLDSVTYNCASGKYMPIITAYQTKNGEHLIIAVAVEPCKEK